MTFNSHANDHMLDPHALAVRERPPNSSLLELVNLDFLADKSKDSDVVRFIVLHTHWICLLAILVLLYFQGFSLRLKGYNFLIPSLSLVDLLLSLLGCISSSFRVV